MTTEPVKQSTPIVVVIDPEALSEGTVPPGLINKSVTLAIQTHSPLELVTVVFEEELELLQEKYPDQGIELKDRFCEGVNRKLESLKLDMLQHCNQQALDIRCEPIYDKYPHEAITRHAAAINAWLIIKHTRHHSLLERLLLTPDDWHLIRSAPAPLLLVKDQPWHSPTHIAAAVDPLHEHGKPRGLDHQLVKLGQKLAQSLNGDLHLVHGSDSMEASLALYAGEAMPTYSDLSQEIRKQHEAAVRQLADELGIEPSHIHIISSNPINAIRQTCQDYQIDITLIGAVSRSPLKRMLLGSTAENILDRIESDVLVIHPADETR